MSRHELDDDDIADPDTEVWVGWDPPLRTFFVQVLSPNDDDPILWAGALPQELPTLENLVTALGSHGTIPAALLATLSADQAANR
jgi:hypothetical protein